METVAHKDGNFALSISISIICIIYVITEQAVVLRKRNVIFWVLLYFFGRSVWEQCRRE